MIKAIAFRIFITVSVSFFLSGCLESWTPLGGWQRDFGPRCTMANLEKVFGNAPGNRRERFEALRQHMDECGPEYSLRAPWLLEALASQKSVAYNYREHPAYGNHIVLLPNAETVRVELFLQNTQSPRPLVIVKCGLLCDQGDASLRQALMYFFDQAPFHVLLVPSITGASYQTDNRRLAVGGVDEGRQLVAISKYILSNDFRYRNRVSRVHVLGMSLGGQAALYAGLYNSFQKDPNGNPWISSVFAACPVVDLKGSIEHLNRSGIVGTVFRHLFWSQVDLLSSVIPGLDEWVYDERGRKNIREVPEIIARGALDYYKRVTVGGKYFPAPFEGQDIRIEEDLWALNRFQDFAHLNTTPTYVWAAKDDPIVSSRVNVERLLEFQSKNPDSPLHLLYTPNGYHCGFSEAYGWKMASRIMSGLVLSESPELQTERSSRYVSLGHVKFPREARATRDYTRSSLRFEFDSRGNPLIVQRFVYSCHKGQPDFFGNEQCKSYVRTPIVWEDLGFGFPVPQTSLMRDVLTRRLNQMTVFVGASQDNLRNNEHIRGLMIYEDEVTDL